MLGVSWPSPAARRRRRGRHHGRRPGAVGEKIGELVGGAPALASGLDMGQLALGQVEAHIPLLDSGRSWLEVQAAKMGGFYGESRRGCNGPSIRWPTFWRCWPPGSKACASGCPSARAKAADVMSALTNLLAGRRSP